jgi:hypothetical protein
MCFSDHWRFRRHPEFRLGLGPFEQCERGPLPRDEMGHRGINPAGVTGLLSRLLKNALLHCGREWTEKKNGWGEEI